MHVSQGVRPDSARLLPPDRGAAEPSILGPEVTVASQAEVFESGFMEDVHMGPGGRIHRAILDKAVHPADACIGGVPLGRGGDIHISPGDVRVVPRGTERIFDGEIRPRMPTFCTPQAPMFAPAAPAPIAGLCGLNRKSPASGFANSGSVCRLCRSCPEFFRHAGNVGPGTGKSVFGTLKTYAT